MNDHLSDDELIGNIHRTLNDARRESMDKHLAACPQCRARLSDHEVMQQHIRHSLIADMRGVQPSAGMKFAAITSRVKGDKYRAFRQLSHQLFPITAASAALIGLALALVDLPESIIRLFTNPEPASASSFSALACIFLSVATVGNYRESRLFQWRRKLYALLASVIWLGTAIVGLQAMAILREALSWFVFQASNNPKLAFALGNWALIPLGLVWIAVVIGGAEYQYRRGAQRISWTLFAWVIAVELSILILALLL
jgi:hypothetical protein